MGKQTYVLDVKLTISYIFKQLEAKWSHVFDINTKQTDDSGVYVVYMLISSL